MTTSTASETEQPSTPSYDSKFDKLLDLTLPFSAALILIQAGIMIADIIYGMVTPAAGFYLTNRIAQTLLIWITFLSLALHDRDDEHIQVTYFYKKLPDKFDRAFDVIESLLNLVFAWLVLNGSIEVLQDIRGLTTSEGIPTEFIYLPLTIATALLLVVFGRDLLEATGIRRRLGLGGGSDG
jgi:TRAP-type C4-dicarboxylate transport system permease small subunit